MHAFWRLGYEGASLGVLTQATGVSRPTLYATFGDKNELFHAALDHYAATIGAAPMQAFIESDDIRDAVQEFLRVSLEGNTRSDAPSGCLIACCAGTTAECDPDVRSKLYQWSQELAEALASRFATEVDKGRLPAEPSPSARAQMLGDFMRAQAVLARSGTPRDEMMEGLAARTCAVLGSGVSPLT